MDQMEIVPKILSSCHAILSLTKQVYLDLDKQIDSMLNLDRQPDRMYRPRRLIIFNKNWGMIDLQSDDLAGYYQHQANRSCNQYQRAQDVFYNRYQNALKSSENYKH